MAKKTTLACKPCGTMVIVTDQGEAVIECFECGEALVPKAVKKPAARKAVKAAAPKKLAAPKKPAAKKPAARKVAPKKNK